MDMPNWVPMTDAVLADADIVEGYEAEYCGWTLEAYRDSDGWKYVVVRPGAMKADGVFPATDEADAKANATAYVLRHIGSIDGQ